MTSRPRGPAGLHLLDLPVPDSSGCSLAGPLRWAARSPLEDGWTCSQCFACPCFACRPGRCDDKRSLSGQMDFSSSLLLHSVKSRSHPLNGPSTQVPLPPGSHYFIPCDDSQILQACAWPALCGPTLVPLHTTDPRNLADATVRMGFQAARCWEGARWDWTLRLGPNSNPLAALPVDSYQRDRRDLPITIPSRLSQPPTHTSDWHTTISPPPCSFCGTHLQPCRVAQAPNAID
jgi:hypothetical protein